MLICTVEQNQMKKNLTEWFRDISIKNKLYYITGIMLLLIILELSTLWTMVYFLSATRAYVGGEGLWSKAEKDATHNLLKYITSQDEKYYQQYLSFIRVTLGDKKARLELQKAQPDYAIATQGFIEGRNQPQDIPGMLTLFSRFQHIYYLQKAIKLWQEADEKISTLLTLSENVHKKISEKKFTLADQNKAISDIEKLNAVITVIADNFSYALGDASRWLENIVLKALLAIAITVEVSGLLLTIFVTFNIRKGIYEIIRVSKNILKLNFKDRATRYSNDEIGQLANAFNQMIDDLEKSTTRQMVRYSITKLMIEHSRLDTLMPKILQVIAEKLQLDYGALWKMNHVNNTLRCADTWAVEEINIQEFAKLSKAFVMTKGMCLPGSAWESKTICVVEDIAKKSDCPRFEIAQKANLHGAFAFPIFVDKDVFGVIEFFSHRLYVNDADMTILLKDISNQMEVFFEREQAQNRIITLSRYAGMAEVAASVLHNVGNTLNSINISAQLVGEKIKNSPLDKLPRLNDLLQEHKDNMNHFLTDHSAGKRIPELIALLANEWKIAKKYYLEEIISLKENIDHVNSVILMQQSLSHSYDLTEEVFIPDLLEDALIFNKTAYTHAGIEIIRDYKTIKKVIIDRVKVFQVFINLVKNAIDALVENNNIKKQLILRLREQDENYFMVQVIDNGIGITQENIVLIFSDGFTTKKTGHGFGLHNSALFAKALGGSLTVESDGTGLGATFSLILPYISASKKEKREEYRDTETESS